MSRSLSVSTVKLCVLEYKHKTGFLKRNFINELLIMQKIWYSLEMKCYCAMPLKQQSSYACRSPSGSGSEPTSLCSFYYPIMCAFRTLKQQIQMPIVWCMTRRDLSVIRECHGHFGWLMVFRATFNNISVISWRSVLLVEERPKIKYVCLRHPTDPIFSAAYPNLFIGNYSTLIFASDPINFYTYNPSKFSMDNAWTSNPTCANMTLEIPTSNKHRTSDAF
jgi:hypothetical protein